MDQQRSGPGSRAPSRGGHDDEKKRSGTRSGKRRAVVLQAVVVVLLISLAVYFGTSSRKTDVLEPNSEDAKALPEDVPGEVLAEDAPPNAAPTDSSTPSPSDDGSKPREKKSWVESASEEEIIRELSKKEDDVGEEEEEEEEAEEGEKGKEQEARQQSATSVAGEAATGGKGAEGAVEEVKDGEKAGARSEDSGAGEEGEGKRATILVAKSAGVTVEGNEKTGVDDDEDDGGEKKPAAAAAVAASAAASGIAASRAESVKKGEDEEEEEEDGRKESKKVSAIATGAVDGSKAKGQVTTKFAAVPAAKSSTSPAATTAMGRIRGAGGATVAVPKVAPKEKLTGTDAEEEEEEAATAESDGKQGDGEPEEEIVGGVEGSVGRKTGGKARIFDVERKAAGSVGVRNGGIVLPGSVNSASLVTRPLLGAAGSAKGKSVGDGEEEEKKRGKGRSVGVAKGIEEEEEEEEDGEGKPAEKKRELAVGVVTKGTELKAEVKVSRSDDDDEEEGEEEGVSKKVIEKVAAPGRTRVGKAALVAAAKAAARGVKQPLLRGEVRKGESVRETEEEEGEEDDDDEEAEGKGKGAKVAVAAKPKAETSQKEEEDDDGDKEIAISVPPSCDGRNVFVYRLPSTFNRKLVEQCETLLPWHDMCPYFQNDGLGEKVRATEMLVPPQRWYETHTYALELIFHYRLRKKYPCLTTDPEAADIFYIPFYGALDTLKWHFAQNATHEKRDAMSVRLLQWLRRRSTFKRFNGTDHFLVLGKVTWDFRRTENSEWGNTLLLMPEMGNVKRLLLEAHPWDSNDIAIPHPTHFHPRQEKDFGIWQRHVEAYERTSLVSFPALRDFYPAPKEALTKQCQEQATSCRFMECIEDICSRPQALMGLFLSSHFCIVAPGHVSVRRAAFDALIAGCIPVFIDTFMAEQYKWHLPEDNRTYSVIFPKERVLSGKVNIVTKLQKVSEKTIKRMRSTIIWDILPHIVYDHPLMRPGGQHKDAFDIALEKLLALVKDEMAPLKAQTS